MVSEHREKKNPNYFRFIRESILGNLSVTVFHSDHPSHLLKLPINPHRRRPFPVTFPAKSFSNTDHTIRCARRRSLTFLKAPDEESQPRASLLRRPESHVPAREGAWGIFRPRASTSSLTWHRPTTLHLRLCHLSPKSAFFGVFFCLRWPSKPPFWRPPVTSSPPRALHMS